MLGNPKQSRRILVTGGAGFIGAVAARRLLDAGHEVTIADYGDSPRHERARAELGDAEWVTDDLLELDLVDLLEGFSHVVHLAGRPGVQTSWGEGFTDHLNLNPLLTQRLLEAAVVTQPDRLVLASSSSVYGDIGDGFAAETRPLRPLSPYGVSKAAVESLMGAYTARGVDAVALRFFTVYGRGQRPDMAIHRIIDAALGGPEFPLRGSGHQARDFTHVDDAATAIEAALFRSVDPGTTLNVGSGRPVPLLTLIKEVERHLGCRVPIMRVGEVSGDPSRTAADSSQAHRLLGWVATRALAEGVADQVRHHPERRAPATIVFS